MKPVISFKTEKVNPVFSLKNEKSELIPFFSYFLVFLRKKRIKRKKVNPVFRFSFLPGKNEFIEEKTKKQKKWVHIVRSRKKGFFVFLFFSQKKRKTKNFNMLTKTRNISIKTLNIFLTKNLIF